MATPRRPRYGRFIGTGAVAGLGLALLLALSRAPAPGYDRAQVLLYLGLALGLLGGLAGGGVAVLLDARAERRR